jgi:ribosome biogenesis protein Nip4
MKSSSLQEFVSQFTAKKLFDEKHLLQMGNEFFLVEPALAELNQKMQKQLAYIGNYLGRFGSQHFIPSVWLIEQLGKIAQKKVFVNEKGEWLFVCGRNLWGGNITKAEGELKKGDLAFVFNKYDECLGYGAIVAEKLGNKAFLDRVFDIGDLIRRERKKK